MITLRIDYIYRRNTLNVFTLRKMGIIFQIIMVGIDRKFILGNQKLPDGVEKIKIIYFELDPHAADVVFVFILKNRPYTYLLQSDLYAEQ